MENEEVIRVLEEIAFLLEVSGENPFKARSYTNAANKLAKQKELVDRLVQEKRLRSIEGVGEAIEKKITELVSTGTLAYHRSLLARFPESLLELRQVHGLGPQRVRLLYQGLGVDSLASLERACASGAVLGIKGFSEKRRGRLGNILNFLRQQQGYSRINTAREEAEAICTLLKQAGKARHVEVVGSVRRFKEVARNINLLAASDDPVPVMESFINALGREKVGTQTAAFAAGLLDSGIPMDLRVVTPDQLAAAMVYYTGSVAHVNALCWRAAMRGWTLCGTGLLQADGNRMPCDEEQAVYESLDLPFLPPEIREGTFEFGLQAPVRLLESQDLQGMIHCHSDWSDGLDSMKDMALAARELGYRYLVLTDHSQSSVYVNGLAPDRVIEQHHAIDRLNAVMAAFRVFKGIESDIHDDGSLDYPPDVLAAFEFVIASVHSGFDMSEKQATRRIVKAIENPCTDVIGHLTGRLLLSRPGYPVDTEKVIDAAAANGVAIEINANPRRLDMDWRHLRHAAEKGVRFIIGPDAHRVAGMQNMRYGIGIARKGALTPEHVLNCKSLEEFVQWRKSR